MRVIGGVYSEYCYHPDWHQLFGSGGRGAATLTRLGLTEVSLTTCIPVAARRAIYATLLPYGIQIDPIESETLYEFRYTHPLSEPLLSPVPIQQVTYKDTVHADTALVYGMLEGLPPVEADRVIYDPQSESDAFAPTTFIKKAGHLALVLNEREVTGLAGQQDVEKAAHSLLHKFKAATIIVKQGPYGSLVVEHDAVARIPVYPSRNVFKIGSGDVFSAAFAKFWGNDRRSAPTSAELASRCASLYCDSGSIDAVARHEEASLSAAVRKKQPSVYLAGPFFSLSQRFLVEEARRSVLALGAKVFSPLHDVGFDSDPRTIATEDIKGLEASTAVLALIADLDPGTIFEIGYARARSIPVVAYSEGVKEQHLTMLLGSRCMCSDDFCSSLYNTIWAGMQ